MNRLRVAIATGVLLFAAGGCMSVKQASAFRDVKVDAGKTPVAVVEIENSVWLLLNFVPLGSGNPDRPNGNSCRWFRNTVSLDNNMKVLRAAMAKTGVRDVANLTSRYTDEKFLFFLLARRACHTSAVLVRPDRADGGAARPAAGRKSLNGEP
ncbi:MAG: hypothetical protein ACI4Q3_07885 [Kiritimatiellia bacterium]